MIEYNKRRSPRLKQYDYSQNGAYFVTICAKNRECLFESSVSVVGEGFMPSRIPQIINETINRIVSQNNIDCPIYVIMPNHIHCIIIINQVTNNANVENTEREGIKPSPTKDGSYGVFEFVRDFKSLTTIEYIKLVREGDLPLFNGKIWQRSYHDHIIRNQNDYSRIYEYIQNNPLHWDIDCHNSNNINYADEAVGEPALQRALAVEKIFLTKTAERLLYENRQKAIQTYDATMEGRWKDGILQGKNIGLAEGELIGLDKGRIAIVKHMISKGLALETVAEMTGLSLEEIDKLL